MASVCATASTRRHSASCLGRGALLPRLLPLPARTAAAPVARRCAAAAAGRAVHCAALADDDTEEQEWGQTVKRFDFTYMSAEGAAEVEAAAEAAWQAGMDEYAALQEWLLFRTWRFGLLFAGYLLFAASGEAAFCELVGAAAGYGYLKLLIADVSRVQPGDGIGIHEAEEQPALARWPAKLAAGYRQALQPRMVVLPGLVAAAAAWNAVFPDAQLSLVEQGCLLGGFLSYKVALALKIYEDVKPKPMTEEELLRQSRPMLVQVEDVDINLRAIGRKKAEAEAAGEAAAAERNGAAAPKGQQQPAQEQLAQQEQQQWGAQ